MKLVAQRNRWEVGRQLSLQERADLDAIKDVGVCALCRRARQRLVYEHDHSVGQHGGRGMTCELCNSHMTGIDAGRFAIDLPTRHYLMNPWHLTRMGKRLPYDPLIHLSVRDLPVGDRRELDRICGDDSRIPDYAIERLRPEFEHPALMPALRHGDIRNVLRLRLMNVRGHLDQDVAEVRGPQSTVQRSYLSAIAIGFTQTPTF